MSCNAIFEAAAAYSLDLSAALNCKAIVNIDMIYEQDKEEKCKMAEVVGIIEA